MELFGGVIEKLYLSQNQTNITYIYMINLYRIDRLGFFRVCGTYEQLEYWPNGFDDFFVS
jgi:hypothetical protein